MSGKKEIQQTWVTGVRL